MKGTQVFLCFFFNDGPNPSPTGDNYEKAKIRLRNFKILFSRTTRQISTKLGTNHSWLKWIQFSSNDGPRSFRREDNHEITKIHCRNLKIFFSRTTGAILTILSLVNEDASSNDDFPFSEGKNYEIAKFKNLLIQNNWPISTKFGTNHSLMR